MSLHGHAVLVVEQLAVVADLAVTVGDGGPQLGLSLLGAWIGLRGTGEIAEARRLLRQFKERERRERRKKGRGRG